MVPTLPEDSIVVSLPFGGAVLRSLGCSTEEVNVLLEETRKKFVMEKGGCVVDGVKRFVSTVEPGAGRRSMWRGHAAFRCYPVEWIQGCTLADAHLR